MSKMASIKFLIRGSKPLSPIYVRFVHTREIDISLKTNIIINPKFWDAKKELIKNVLEVKNRDDINFKLREIKLHISNQFNASYIQGEIIDKNWLEKEINAFFNRPASESNFVIKKEEVYLSYFITWWLDNIAPTYKISTSKYLSDRSIVHYTRFKELIIEFEKKDKLKFSELDNKVLDSFSFFLSDNKMYSHETTRRHISRFKFFCERAEERNIPVNKGYKQRVFIKENIVEYKDPYLNIDEINSLFELKIEDETTEAIRDNFIIGLWTGLRVSDFLSRLSTENIKDGFILIKTKKTKHDVAIPLHPQVRKILNKRFGLLPPKCTDQHFNRVIKEICKEAKISKRILGAKTVIKTDDTGQEVTRKEVGHYPKHELVTSHICRRSFATNHFGKVSNKVIMDVCGWKSESQMLEYIKQTNIDSALLLADYWKTEMKKLESEIA